MSEHLYHTLVCSLLFLHLHSAPFRRGAYWGRDSCDGSAAASAWLVCICGLDGNFATPLFLLPLAPLPLVPLVSSCHDGSSLNARVSHEVEGVQRAGECLDRVVEGFSVLRSMLGSGGAGRAAVVRSTADWMCSD